ncbi:unnamed protein product [Amoebophrya sp. A120]|nr:unnamed protein product [Amoebophrya sp. A120]|eukprot:GSA120T00011791001.1
MSPPASVSPLGDQHEDGTTAGKVQISSSLQNKMTAFVPATASAPSPGAFGMAAGGATSFAPGIQQAPYQTMQTYMVRAKMEFQRRGVTDVNLDQYLNNLQWAFGAEIFKRDWQLVDLPTEDQVRRNEPVKLQDSSLLIPPCPAAQPKAAGRALGAQQVPNAASAASTNGADTATPTGASSTATGPDGDQAGSSGDSGNVTNVGMNQVPPPPPPPPPANGATPSASPPQPQASNPLMNSLAGAPATALTPQQMMLVYQQQMMALRQREMQIMQQNAMNPAMMSSMMMNSQMGVASGGYNNNMWGGQQRAGPYSNNYGGNNAMTAKAAAMGGAGAFNLKALPGGAQSKTGITSRVVPASQFPLRPVLPKAGMTANSSMGGFSGGMRFGKAGAPVLPVSTGKAAGMILNPMLKHSSRTHSSDSRGGRSRSRSRSRGRGRGRGRRYSSRDRDGRGRGNNKKPGSQPSNRGSEEWRQWVKDEFKGLMWEKGGPSAANVSSDVIQHFQKTHGVNAKLVKDVLGVPPGKYVGQLKLQALGKRNLIDGSLTVDEVMEGAAANSYNNGNSYNSNSNIWGWDDPAAARRKKEREDRFKGSSTSNAASILKEFELNWDDDDMPLRLQLDDEKPLLGELDALCSEKEILDRETTRQLDRFEVKPTRRASAGGTSTLLSPPAAANGDKAPVADRSLCVKKYQRSSADKQYSPKDIRTLAACFRSVEYLFKEVIDLDTRTRPTKFVFTELVPYIQIYSFIRDRIRAVRVDLHVQQPLSTVSKEYIKTHEAAFRFELLSNFIIKADYVANLFSDKKGMEKYDEKMAQKAISQTVEPLLFAYKKAREETEENKKKADEKLKGKNLAATTKPNTKEQYNKEDDLPKIDPYISPFEANIRRYVILMQLSNSEQVQGQLQRLDLAAMSDLRVQEALDLYKCYQSGNCAAFFDFYRTCDFLSAVSLGNLVDVMRYRQMVCLVKSIHPTMGDQVPLAAMMDTLCFCDPFQATEFLEFVGCVVKNVSPTSPRLAQAAKALGKRAASVPQMVHLPGREAVIKHKMLLQPGATPALPEALHKTKDEILQALKPYYKRVGARDSMVIDKYDRLIASNLTRADIIFGRTDLTIEGKRRANRERMEARERALLEEKSQRKNGEATSFLPSPTPASSSSPDSDKSS